MLLNNRTGYNRSVNISQKQNILFRSRVSSYKFGWIFFGLVGALTLSVSGGLVLYDLYLVADGSMGLLTMVAGLSAFALFGGSILFLLLFESWVCVDV